MYMKARQRMASKKRNWSMTVPVEGTAVVTFENCTLREALAKARAFDWDGFEIVESEVTSIDPADLEPDD